MQNRLRSKIRSSAALALVVGSVSAARAGGYDTPMLYSARHMGMGGTAIGYVRDPSALFHNPAGLAHIERGAVLGDFSLLVGGIHGSPSATGTNIDSATTVAPFFLLGGGYRVTDFLVVGLGVYPVASAGATYHYGRAGFEDKTTLFFVEASPAIALNLPEHVRLAVGYRVTYVRLERYQGVPGDPAGPAIDFDLKGFNWLGLRAGVEWSATPWLEFGAVYRHRTKTKVKNDTGIALRHPYTEVSNELVLASKLGLGSRLDLNRFGPHLSVAVDAEYTFNSQNPGTPLRGQPVPDPTQPSLPSTVENVFEWQDSVTLRLGLEYRMLPGPFGQPDRLAVRAGYVHDGTTTNRQYPSAFGTPPGPTQIFTVGGGWNGGPWQVNLAYAYRFGSGTVSEADLTGPNRKACAFCGDAGDYRIHLNGIYVDAGYDF